MKSLIHSVIWLAVAGNILWAFLYVAVDPKFTGIPMWTKLIALFAIGLYLSRDWIKRSPVVFRDDWKYWAVDITLAAALATFAIATQSKPGLEDDWSGWVLAFAFAIAIFGHCKGSWDSIKKSQATSRCRHAKYAGFNAIGLVILGFGLLLDKLPYAIFPPAAISVVVVLFLCFE